MRSQELRDLLEPLRADAVRHLAGRLDLGGGTRANLLQTVALRYSRRPRVVFDALRREDLHRCLRDWAGTCDDGEFCLGGLADASPADLVDAAQRCWIDGWAPAADGEAVRPGSPVTAVLLFDRASLPWTLAPSGASDPGAGAGDGATSGLPSFEEIPTGGDAHLEEVGRGLASFQLEAVAALQRRLERGRRALLCLPTGGGKTRTVLRFLLSRYVAQGVKVLWVTHRLDLLDQVHEEVREGAWQLARKRDHVRVSRVDDGDFDARGDIFLASAATLARDERALARLGADTRLGIVVHDEAHRLAAPAAWRLIDRLLRDHDRALLGLTATPYRQDPAETETLRRVLGPPTYFKTFGDLIRTGFLAQPVFLRLAMRSAGALRLEEADVAEAQRTGDLSGRALSAIASTPGRDEEIVTRWLARRAQYGKTLVFACDAEHADRLARAFAAQGVGADPLHGSSTPDERRRVLQRFRQGDTQVLVNAGVLTEGANVPDTRTVLLARPTLSPSLYLQMIGRGARGPSTVQGKTEFSVVDCVDHLDRHGLVSAGVRAAAELDEAVRESARAESGGFEIQGAGTIERAGFVAGALRLLARGFAPSAYTPWGELRWQGAHLAVVFVETRGLMEAALRRLGVGLETRRFDRLDAEGVELDRCGALRRSEWDAAVLTCHDGGRVPELVEVPGSWSADDLALATDVDALVRSHTTWTAARWAEFLRGDAAWSARLGDTFDDAAASAEFLALVAEDVRTANDLPPTEADGPRNAARDAADFSAIAHALTWNGESVDPQESQVINTACRLLFGHRSITPDTWDALDDDPLKEAAARLGDGLSSRRGAEVVDHLIRVVLADGQVDVREQHILGLAAPFLGVPAGVVLDRLGDVDLRDPVESVERELLEDSGRLTCRACCAVLPGDARFCGLCGGRLTAEAD